MNSVPSNLSVNLRIVLYSAEMERARLPLQIRTILNGFVIKGSVIFFVFFVASKRPQFELLKSRIDVSLNEVSLTNISRLISEFLSSDTKIIFQRLIESKDCEN